MTVSLVPPACRDPEEVIAAFRALKSGNEPFKTDALLKSLYVVQKLNITQVSRALGVSTKAVSRALDWYGIPKREKNQRRRVGE